VLCAAVEGLAPQLAMGVFSVGVKYGVLSVLFFGAFIQRYFFGGHLWRAFAGLKIRTQNTQVPQHRADSRQRCVLLASATSSATEKSKCK
jgi:hypothetical protein